LMSIIVLAISAGALTVLFKIRNNPGSIATQGNRAIGERRS
jgi:hypothetical protein